MSQISAHERLGIYLAISAWQCMGTPAYILHTHLYGSCYTVEIRYVGAYRFPGVGTFLRRILAYYYDLFAYDKEKFQRKLQN